MYTLYKFHFLNGISEINQLFDDILIIWPAPVYMSINKPKNVAQFVHIHKQKQGCRQARTERIVGYLALLQDYGGEQD